MSKANSSFVPTKNRPSLEAGSGKASAIVEESESGSKGNTSKSGRPSNYKSYKRSSNASKLVNVENLDHGCTMRTEDLGKLMERKQNHKLQARASHKQPRPE